MQKLEDEPQMEHVCLHRAYEGLRDDGGGDGRLEAWAEGETGFPFVDACMRSLKHTGWLNFRMRSMVTAFASYHLWLDWRATGAVLARRFSDFEPGIHWSQMLMQSGVTGVNATRVYNPVKQSLDQDPNGAFIRAYVPELAHLPTAFLHEPWRMGAGEQRAYCVHLDATYPMRIVDHIETARRTSEFGAIEV